ncbi:hypothetical protein JS562_51955 [Agrobacterium sp. S2]|nr:hypothetical protein [Agrobacterium sp. S2]
MWSAARHGLTSADIKLDELASGIRDDRVVPEIVSIGVVPMGLEMTVAMLPGQHVSDYEKAALRLAPMWAVERVRVRAGEPGFVRMTPVTSTPLAKSTQVSVDTIPAMADLESVEVGRTEDGAPWRFPLLESHAVVGGVPGAGKSRWLAVLLAGVSQRPDVQIIGIDCAGGVELSDWQPRLSALATNQEEAIEVLEALWVEHERRVEWLKAHGYRSMANAGLSAEMPLLLCVVDEAAQLFMLNSTDKEEVTRGKRLVALVTRLITVSRKSGVVVVLATQKPVAETLPTLCRDNAQVKIAFRVTTLEAAKSVLGDSVHAAPVSPTEIKREQKGVAVAEGPDGDLTLVRSYYMDEEADRAVAQAYAHLRRPLSEIGTEERVERV